MNKNYLYKYQRTIYVTCKQCKERFDELKVEFCNIEEDFQGRDVLYFICPTCKIETSSWRVG